MGFGILEPGPSLLSAFALFQASKLRLAFPSQLTTSQTSVRFPASLDLAMNNKNIVSRQLVFSVSFSPNCFTIYRFELCISRWVIPRENTEFQMTQLLLLPWGRTPFGTSERPGSLWKRQPQTPAQATELVPALYRDPHVFLHIKA